VSNRRAFLKQVGAIAAFYPVLTKSIRASPLSSTGKKTENPSEDWHELGFKPHWIKQGDGRGGWVLRPAEIRFVEYGNGTIPYFDIKGDGTMIFGVAQMDNGEVIAVGTWDTGEMVKDPRISSAKPIVAFSRDGANSWTEFKQIEGGNGRPLVLTYLGKGNLSFQTDGVRPIMQYFSSDYGRTWPERQPLQPDSHGNKFFSEGNALVDRNTHGVATRIALTGAYTMPGKGPNAWPEMPTTELIRWSSDGGRTWTNESAPKEWQFEVEYRGKTYRRGACEGSLVRAANGWIVAAIRTDVDPGFFSPAADSMCGIGTSVSKDNGKTWTPVHRLYHAGRHHTCLTVMPNSDIVMTYIERLDMENGRLATYRRGCGAVISRDNGLTWDMAHQYILDSFDFSDGTPFALTCGHQYSTLLNDGHILTSYSNYTAKSGVLIRWKPTSA
jgi:hypothetical protein